MTNKISKPKPTDLISIRTVRKLKMELQKDIRKLLEEFHVASDGVEIGSLSIRGPFLRSDGEHDFGVTAHIIGLGG